jgi:hypothetical protein
MTTLADRITSARSRLVEIEALVRLFAVSETDRATGIGASRSDQAELVDVVLRTIAKAEDELFWFGYLPPVVQSTPVPSDDEREAAERSARAAEASS